MRVVKAFGPGDLRLVTAPEPAPGEGEVLIAVRASGICGSDKWYWRVDGPTDFIAGHEVAGVVAALGPGVRRLRPGDRVAVNNVVGCGVCPACREGSYVWCAARPGRDVFNGFGELLVAPERNCLRLEAPVTDEMGCLIFDNWGTPYAALQRGGVTAGDRVVVTGCGPIGLAAVALGRMLGARVIAVDPLAYRREKALGMGAEATVPPDADAADAIRDLTGGGARAVLECSGQGASYLLGLAALGNGGVLVAVGEGARFELQPSEALIHKQLSIIGSWYSTMQQGREVQELILDGRLDPLATVSHRVSLEEVPAAFARICDSAEEVVKTVILMPGP